MTVWEWVLWYVNVFFLAAVSLIVCAALFYFFWLFLVKIFGPWFHRTSWIELRSELSNPQTYKNLFIWLIKEFWLPSLALLCAYAGWKSLGYLLGQADSFFDLITIIPVCALCIYTAFNLFWRSFKSLKNYYLQYASQLNNVSLNQEPSNNVDKVPTETKDTRPE